jgi:hypothetical protein
VESIAVETFKHVERVLGDATVLQDVIRRDVPMLSADWGARDEDALLHTLGINFFAGLARAAGYFGLAEFPVPRAEQWQQKLVRVDSAWFDRAARRPVVLVEFERFSIETVLEKLTNLYVAAHGCDVSPDVLMLCIWAMDGVPVDIKWFGADRVLAVSGGPAVRRPDRSRVMLTQAVMGRQGDALHLIRFRRLA